MHSIYIEDHAYKLYVKSGMHSLNNHVCINLAISKSLTGIATIALPCRLRDWKCSGCVYINYIDI